ncbi:flagellar export protein FliJ [Ligilactobacillus salitolerans]|nr:flagellar export protein FliJ [Ligilactobacillus salitolerans]
MENFTFSLQKVLEYRMQVEDQVKAQFAQIVAAENQQSSLLDEVVQEKNAMMETPQRSLGRMQVTRRYLMALNEQIMLCRQQLLELGSQKEEVRAQLIEAQKQRKVLERLKAKQLTAFKKELAVDQQKQLDDFHRPKQLLGVN